MFDRRLAALAIVLILSPLNPCLAQSDARQQLDNLLADISTLSADVQQLIVESDGGVLEESEIRMYLKKPDGFYWETISPFPELVVTNGELLWNYQPDLEQVVIEDWDAQQSELAAQLLNGNTDSLSEEYQISSDGREGEVIEFDLTPLAADSVYRVIKIAFVGEKLDMIHLHNKNGEQTVWRFNGLEKNLELQDSMFEFEPPEGIEVIENSYTN